MPNERQAAIKAVVEAWTNPGIDPAEHEAWKQRIAQASPEGWPMLSKAVEQLVAVEQQTARGKAKR